MIVLKTCLANDGIFFAGEALTCTITFSNEESPKDRQKSVSTTTETLPAQDLQSSSGGNFPLGSNGEVGADRDLKKMLSIDTFKAIANGIYNLSAGTVSQSTPSAISQSLPYTPATSELVAGSEKPPRLPSIPAESNEELYIKTIEHESDELLKNKLYQEPMASDEGGIVNLSSAPSDRHIYQKRVDEDTKTQDDEPKQYNTNQLASRIKNSLPRLRTSSVTSEMSSGGENISWAFVQIVGQFIVDTNYLDSKPFDILREKVMYQSPGSSGGFGGGGMLGPTSPAKSGSKNALPLFNTPPSILFIDQSLSPGESKTYMYEILLPAVLPPSHRGKVIRFQYKLIVGLQKSSRKKMTQVVTIPFRFFNRTNIDGSRPIYDQFNPIINIRDLARVSALDKTDFDVLSPFCIEFLQVKSPILAHMDSGLTLSTTSSRMELDIATSTIDNVSRTIQSCGKISYDVCKNNEHVATLTLVRLSYRLGESVTAVLEFSKSSIPCYHVSAFLETHETIDPDLALKSKSETTGHSRQCHGENHQYTLNSRRAVVAINIPTRSTPDYKSTATSIQWTLRMEFITGATAKILANTAVMDGFSHNRCLPKVHVEPFDCVIPLKVYGALKTNKERPKVQSFEIN